MGIVILFSFNLRNVNKESLFDKIVKLSNLVSNQLIIGLRGLILVFTLLANGLMHYQRIINGTRSIFYDFLFFTTQTNYVIMIWMFLFFIWKNDQKKLDRLNGYIKGALTVYITLVALVYIILIAPDHNPQDLFVFSNLLHHYIIPPLFVLDTLLTQTVKYQSNWKFIWLSYPLVYLPFALIIAELSGIYTYFFINIPEIGLISFITWVSIMIALFFVVGSIYSVINSKLVKDQNVSKFILEQ